ncbi:MAG: glycosyltransferase [Hungatella sp.]|nr:glycosyltransferase [Hungatella sp.]
MNLLMFTKYYPFGKGEAFIENEIETASEYFENIVIIACEVGIKEDVVRKLPQNVNAFKVPRGSKVKNILCGLRYLFSADEVFNSEKTECRGLIQKIFLAYFEKKSRAIYDYIVDKGYTDNVYGKPYAIYSYWLFVTARVGLLITEGNKPVYKFTRAHRYDLYQEKNRLNYLPYRRLFLQEYENVFPCSNHGSQYLIKAFAAFEDHIKTAFLGTKDYGLSRESRDGAFRIVSCSRIEPVKRIHRIIEALSLLKADNRGIEWIHMGGGSKLEKIRKKAEAELHGITCTFTGAVPNSKVLEIYRNSPVDLFINVSSSEGLPVSIMEAISFGIPVIATDVGGTSEIVIHGLTGFLIPSEFTNEELARTIKRMYENRDTLISRRACREYWEQHFQADRNYHKMYDYLSRNYHLQ